MEREEDSLHDILIVGYEKFIVLYNLKAPKNTVMFGFYFLEVYVSKLILNKDAYKDSGGEPLAVKVDLIQFPALQIFEDKRLAKGDTYFFEFNRGQAYHFSMKSDELLKKMKRTPIKIGVYRDGDSFPICQTRTHLSGCACDLGSETFKDLLPFSFKGPFNLVDPGDNYAGELGVDISIRKMERFVVTHYALGVGYFVFKNSPNEEEYQCAFKDAPSLESTIVGYRSFIRKNNLANTVEGTKPDNIFPGNLMKDIAGISPVAERLALGRPPEKPPRPPLVDTTIISDQTGQITTNKKKEKIKKRKSK